MSTEDQKPVSEQESVKPAEESVQEQEEYVAKKAYQEVTKDMHKFKARNKEKDLKINELETKLKAIEEAKLVENQRFEELYHREKEEADKLRQARENEKKLYERAVKLSALKSELGGNVKDDYLKFADVDRIEIREDGTLSSESVQDVANSFRQEHPALVGKSTQINITHPAAATNVNHSQPEKTLETMSTKEKKELLQKLALEKANRSS